MPSLKLLPVVSFIVLINKLTDLKVICIAKFSNFYKLRNF